MLCYAVTEVWSLLLLYVINNILRMVQQVLLLLSWSLLGFGSNM